MTYDYHGGWDSYTGLNSPMVNIDPNPSAAKWSVTGTMDIYLNGSNGNPGVAPSKLVLGMPFYGRGWNSVQPGPNGNGLGQPGTEAVSPGLGETEFPYNSLISSGILSYSNGSFVGAAGYTRHWNAAAQVPYLYSPTAQRFISYDDPESTQVKMNFANQKALGGVMFWELSEDTALPGASLLDTIFQGMKLP
jgi:chitinase